MVSVLVLLLAHILVHVLVLVLVFVLAVLGFGSTNTVLPTVLGQPVKLEGVTSLLTEHPTAGQAGGRLHPRLCSVQGLLTDPLLLEEGLVHDMLHPHY